MTDLAKAEEWARWAAVHDDWDKTREMMGVLLAEYTRRGRIVEAATALAERWTYRPAYGSVADEANEELRRVLEDAVVDLGRAQDGG